MLLSIFSANPGGVPKVPEAVATGLGSKTERREQRQDNRH